MKAQIKFIVSSANTFTLFIGMFQRQEPLIHMLNFELGRLCTVLLRQIIRSDDVYHHLTVGFESVSSAAEVYLEHPLCNEQILEDLASSKATQNDRKRFS